MLFLLQYFNFVCSNIRGLVNDDFFYLSFFSFYFNVYFRSPQHIKTSMAATAAAARDTTCLEPLVCIYL